ncbi:MAG: hypothetical protein J6I49_01860 [Bacteroidales bacterium]|nr:hypothetical protein [Bacteroidales bacterium]
MSRNTLKTALACAILLAIGYAANAQQPPRWTTNGVLEMENSYLEPVSGMGSTPSEARKAATLEIINRRNMATGSSAEISVENGNVSARVNDQLIVKSRILDEYTEQVSSGQYRVHLLAQTAKHPQNTFEPVSVTSDYPFSARCLVPGMQQLYKGQTVKGIAIIGAEVLAVGGIIVSESLRADYSNRASTERNARLMTEYIDNANNAQNIRNVFIGAAAAVYVWNIVDAIVSKGGKHVVLDKVAMTPYATPDGFGLALNYRF